MPDTLSLSTGVSFGLLAGIVSGVCYLMANGLTWPKNESPQPKRCLSSNSDEGVCRRCGGDSQGGLIPCVCRYHRPVKFESGAWFLRQVQRAVSLMPWSISSDKLEQIDEECEGPENPGPSESRELRNVRDFLESLSAQLAGGPLEGTRIAPLYDHPAYLPARVEVSSSVQHQVSGASGAHAQLKRLVARVVEEAAALPALVQYAAEPTNPPGLESSTYEDLLATAILNKVIERYQTENGSGGRSSGIHSASASPTPSERSSPRSLNSRHTRDISPPLPEEEDVSDWEEGEATDDAQELQKRVPFPDFGGDIVHQENKDRDFDEVSGSDIQVIDGTWEENWLFQKKKIKTIQSVPVPMLVPNSNTEYRALIGDRDADDTTDLSDNASDQDEDLDQEYKSTMKTVLESKHVIGGKPVSQVVEVLDFEPDSLTIIEDTKEFNQFAENADEEQDIMHAINIEISDRKSTSNKEANNNDSNNLVNEHESIILLGVDSGPMSKTEFSLKEEIHRTILHNNADELEFEEINRTINGEELSGDVVDGMSNLKGATNTLSRHEREGEYEETVTVPVQRYADSLRRKHFDDDPQQIPTRDTDKDIDDLIPGSIAYRERKKWLNYVDMPNNPYSPEAIKKRLSNKSTSSIFDMITTNNKNIEDDNINNRVEDTNDIDKQNELPERDHRDKIEPPIIVKGGNDNGRTSQSPVPKILKDVLADEVPQYKRYGRDYYIKEAKLSSGGRKKNSYSDTSSLSSLNKSTSLDNFDTELAAPGLLIKQFHAIAANQHYDAFPVEDPTPMISVTTMPVENKNQIIIEYDEIDNEAKLFSAKPAYADDDTDKKFDEIVQSVYKTNLTLDNIEPKEMDDPERSPTNNSVDNSYVSSSSFEDSIKIYNVQTGEIVKCKPEDSISRYPTAVDMSDNIDIIDKDGLEEMTIVSSQFEIAEDTVEDSFMNSELNDQLAALPNVKELAKKFASMDNLNEVTKLSQPDTRRKTSLENILNGNTDKSSSKQLYMHSLTARSIPRGFREELKLSMATLITVPGGSKEIPEGTEEVVRESSRPGSPLPEPGTIKTKLAFFESLKNKFSTK